MKVLDVQNFHEGVQRNVDMLTRLETEMAAIETTIAGLTQLENSLQGQGGNALRAYYQDCHLPFLQFFQTFKSNFHSILTEMKAALDTLEPDQAGYIQQHYLQNEVEQGLQQAQQVTEELTDETNTIMDSVSDIVALPHLNDTSVLTSIQNAKNHRNTTVENLTTFDRNQTSALSSVESDLQAMKTWVTDLETMMTEGLTDVNFPADEWAQYSTTTALSVTLASRTNQVDDVEESENSEDVPDTHDAILEHEKDVSNTMKFNTAVTGAAESFALFMAGRNGGLSTLRAYDPKKGEYGYRIYANQDALRFLRVNGTTDSRTMLKYATTKPGQSGWSSLGEAALKEHPSLAHWNGGRASWSQNAKTIGSAALQGTKDSFTELVDVKGMVTSGAGRGFMKALGPVGAGLTYYSNYHNAEADGLSGGEAHRRAAVDTAVDVAVGGAVQAAFTAAGTALIPIPGVGTAVGVAAGLAVNGLLNKKGEDGKSVMDHIKGWFH